MASRLKLHSKLEEILGNTNVYYQPPESVKMKYPAIRYKLDDLDSMHADNRVYLLRNKYSITLIDRNPESAYVNKLAMMPTCRLNSNFISENLNHWVFSLYF